MSFLKRRKPPKMNVRLPSHYRSQGHLKFVRGFDCLVAKHGGCGRIPGRRSFIEACHLRSLRTDCGEKLKPSDWWSVPLCNIHHDEQEAGLARFERKYGVDLHKSAADLWKRSPHRHRYEQSPTTTAEPPA